MTKGLQLAVTVCVCACLLGMVYQALRPESPQETFAHVRAALDGIDNYHPRLGPIVMETWQLGLLLIFASCGVAGATLAERKRAATAGFWFGFLFGPLGIVIANFLDNRPTCKRCGGRRAGDERQFPVCLHCGFETILEPVGEPKGDATGIVKEVPPYDDSSVSWPSSVKEAKRLLARMETQRELSDQTSAS